MAEYNPWADVIQQIKNDENETNTDNQFNLTDLNEGFDVCNQNYSINEE